LFTRSFIATLQKMPGMYELVDGLRAKGIVVMLLTNVSPQFAEVLQQTGHYDPFDFKVLSYEIGLWKTEAGFYEHALQKAGIKGEEAVFIDDEEENLRVAGKLGIRGILFKDTEQVKAELAKLLH
jgi:HAD superfamily hydrolase (TIGR01509 family)